MAKKKLEVSLSPIAAHIYNATKKLKKLKPRVSKKELRALESGLKDLLGIRALVVKACRSRMTIAFLPFEEEE
jgi:hypothetical protein